MMKLQEAIQPLITALSAGMGRNGGAMMPGMQQIAQMGQMGGQPYMDMDAMGGMPFTPLQLQQLQAEDPEGFAQLISMMQR